jgi:hypothetical protein
VTEELGAYRQEARMNEVRRRFIVTNKRHGQENAKVTQIERKTTGHGSGANGMQESMWELITKDPKQDKMAVESNKEASLREVNTEATLMRNQQTVHVLCNIGELET